MNIGQMYKRKHSSSLLTLPLPISLLNIISLGGSAALISSLLTQKPNDHSRTAGIIGKSGSSGTSVGRKCHFIL